MAKRRPRREREDHEISSREIQCGGNLTFNFIDAVPDVSTVNQDDLVHGNFSRGENDHAGSAPGGLECFENARNSRRLFGMVITEVFVLFHARVVTVAHSRRRGDTGHV